MGDLQALKAAFSERRLDDAWALYRQLDATDGACAEGHLVGARVAMAREDLLAGRYAIEKAAAESSTGALLGQIRYTRGLILQLLGDVQAAIEQMQACINGVNEYPTLGPVMLGPAWNNLGLLLRQSKRYQEAIDAYTTACGICRTESLPTYLCMALHNLAWTACMMGDRTRAQFALDESEPLATTATLKWHQKITQAYLSALGDLDDQRHAMELCQSLISQPDAPIDIRSHACWVAGQVAMKLGQLEAAEDLAKQAVHHASQDRSESRCLRDAADLLRSIRELRFMSTSSGSL